MKKSYKNVDSFMTDMVWNNESIAGAGDEFDFKAIAKKRKQIFRFWQSRVSQGQNEWDAAEAAVRHVVGPL